MKIAFVGASGYGNVGDDTYPRVFREQLPQAELLFYNSDLPADLPSDLDALVLGGGGILHNVGEGTDGVSHHFRCMQFYMDRAIERRLPWGVLSCGVQFGLHREEHYLVDLAPWVPYLQKAAFITLRSPECVRRIKEITNLREKVRFFPDAACLFRPTAPDAAPDKTRPMLTLVPSGFINPINKHTRHMVRLIRSLDHEVVWMNMGAAVDDDAHLETASRLDPTVRILRNPSPEAAFAQIGASRLVLTGRYHGMLFARIQGVPFYVPEDSPYKICHEDLTVDPSLARGHVETLKAALARIGK